MRINRKVIISTISILLSGCFVQQEQHQEAVKKINGALEEVQALKDSLGGFQYLAIDPLLVFSVKDVEFKVPDSSYGSSSVKFKASIKQTNDSFPLSHYSVNMFFSVLDENDNEVTTVTLSSEIENGVLSVAEDKTMYGIKQLKFTGYKLVAKEYVWHPLYRFKANKS